MLGPFIGRVEHNKIEGDTLSPPLTVHEEKTNEFERTVPQAPPNPPDLPVCCSARVGWSFTPVRIETRFFTGFYQMDKMLLSVNNGLGLTLAPFRYGAPAEVTLVELVASPGDRISGNGQ